MKKAWEEFLFCQKLPEVKQISKLMKMPGLLFLKAKLVRTSQNEMTFSDYVMTEKCATTGFERKLFNHVSRF